METTMNMKHTPGPWEVVKSLSQRGEATTYVIYATSPFQILQSQKGTRFSIGSVSMKEFYGHVWQFPTDKDGEMINGESFNHSALPYEANAKLIAAAPTMFEMLVEFANQTSPDVRKFQQDSLDLLTKITS